MSKEVINCLHRYYEELCEQRVFPYKRMAIFCTDIWGKEYILEEYNVN